MSAALLRVENLVKHFVARRHFTGRTLASAKAVDGLSFDLAAGETLGLVWDAVDTTMKLGADFVEAL